MCGGGHQNRLVSIITGVSTIIADESGVFKCIWLGVEQEAGVVPLPGFFNIRNSLEPSVIL